MKTTAIHRLTRLASVLAPAAALAATSGHMGWSDQTLKREITPLEQPLQRINQL